MEIQTLSSSQSEYPITSQTWFTEIDYIGDIDLINCSMLAIFSSVKCPASLILKAHDYAKEMKDGKTGIISGFHAPAEKEILEVLSKGTCPIIIVMGRTLQNARIPTLWKEKIEKGRMLVISPFKEYQTYVTKEMSMKRNTLAARIAGRVLVVHASEGGSLERQVEKWRMEGIDMEFI